MATASGEYSLLKKSAGEMKKISIALALILSASLLVACSSEGEQFPASVVQNFMDSCVSNGSSQAFCECSLEEVQRTFTFEEFNKLELSITSGQQDEEGMEKLAAARAKCA